MKDYERRLIFDKQGRLSRRDFLWLTAWLPAMGASLTLSADLFELLEGLNKRAPRETISSQEGIQGEQVSVPPLSRGQTSFFTLKTPVGYFCRP